MKKVAALFLIFVLTSHESLLKAEIRREARNPLVHFVVINMSGAAREAHHHGDIIPLPVAVRVPLQVPTGDSIEITSQTNKKVEEAISIAASDEGRTLPIR